MFDQIINFAGGLQSLLFTLAAFAGILILIRLKVPLIVAILAGGVGRDGLVNHSNDI